MSELPSARHANEPDDRAVASAPTGKRRGAVSASDLPAELEADHEYVGPARGCRRPERTLEDTATHCPFKPDGDAQQRGPRPAGCAMSHCAVRKHDDDLVTFINDEDLGESRIYFLRPTNRIGNRLQARQGRAVIEQLADYPVLGVESTRILQGRSRRQ